MEVWQLIPEDWHRPIITQWKAKLEAKGYDGLDIRWSGFSCQGDGASIAARRVERDWPVPDYVTTARMKARLLGDTAIDVALNASVKRSTAMNYVHEYMVDAEVMFQGDYGASAELNDAFDRWATEIEQALTEEVRGLSRELYRELETAYDAAYAEAEEELATDEEEDAA